MPGGEALAGIALFLSAGAGLAELLPALRRMPLVRRLGHAWLLGVVWVAARPRGPGRRPADARRLPLCRRGSGRGAPAGVR